MATAAEPVGGAVQDPAPVEDKTERQVAQILQVVGGDRARAEKVLRLAASATKKVPALARCNATSLWLAVLDVASLGLPFGSRGAFLVPYKGEVQVIISPHGLIELAFRHPLVKSIQARVVRANEDFDIQYAPEPMVRHRPILDGRDPGEKIGAYFICELTTGGRVVEWMSKAEVEKVRNVSKSWQENKGPWKDWEDEMWRKSPLKRGMKYVPQSEEMQRALEIDDSESDLALVEAGAPPLQLAAGDRGVSALKERLRQAEPVAVEREPGEEG